MLYKLTKIRAGCQIEIHSPGEFWWNFRKSSSIHPIHQIQRIHRFYLLLILFVQLVSRQIGFDFHHCIPKITTDFGRFQISLLIKCKLIKSKIQCSIQGVRKYHEPFSLPRRPIVSKTWKYLFFVCVCQLELMHYIVWRAI